MSVSSPSPFLRRRSLPSCPNPGWGRRRLTLIYSGSIKCCQRLLNLLCYLSHLFSLNHFPFVQTFVISSHAQWRLVQFFEYMQKSPGRHALLFLLVKKRTHTPKKRERNKNAWEEEGFLKERKTTTKGSSFVLPSKAFSLPRPVRHPLRRKFPSVYVPAPSSL